jgi:tRNA threonylcarbamoyl adenosine modification protein YeaZ
MLLALDCSQKNITLALIESGKLVASHHELLTMQSKELLQAIDKLIKKTSHSLNDIQKILFCNGPGSFTSLRVGLATLSGLFAQEKTQCSQVSSLLPRCYSLPDADSRLFLMKLGNQRYACGRLKKDEFEEHLFSKSELDVWLKNIQTPICVGGETALLEGHDLPAGSLLFEGDQIHAEAFLKLCLHSHGTSLDFTQISLNYGLSPV